MNQIVIQLINQKIKILLAVSIQLQIIWDFQMLILMKKMGKNYLHMLINI
jgi:hypothetical protein